MYLSFTKQLETLDISKALECNEIYMQLQPKVSLNKEEYFIMGAEALIRWDHPVHGPISPEMILKAAVKQEKMQELTHYCFLWVLDHLKTVKNPNYSVAVNVDPAVFNNQLVDFLKDELKRNGVFGSSLQIEVTESTKIKNFSDLRKVMNVIQEMGIKIYLDDFGTAYASLQYLAKLNFDGVKIDKSFVQNAPTEPHTRLILSSIIQLARALECDVIVEGVETKEHLDLIKSLGVSCVQGYFFFKPLKEESLIRHLDAPSLKHALSYLVLA
ncbi:MAG TPA: EAL domain-containing protein [Alphaproteobacteria bacterium]|nr:EAL domain-containing protein [Alphaproteobacteria bacterium]